VPVLLLCAVCLSSLRWRRAATTVAGRAHRGLAWLWLGDVTWHGRRKNLQRWGEATKPRRYAFAEISSPAYSSRNLYIHSLLLRLYGAWASSEHRHISFPAGWRHGLRRGVEALMGWETSAGAAC